MSGLLNPSEIIKKLPITPGMTIADFGAGSGFFSLALAKELKSNGRVIALDILEKALEALRTRARIERVWPMLETQLADLEKSNGSKLKPESIDMVLISNILFQTTNKSNILKEAKRVLKTEGFLVIIDWNPLNLPNQELHYSINEEEIKKLVSDLGFSLKETISVSNTHYCLLFIKK